MRRSQVGRFTALAVVFMLYAFVPNAAADEQSACFSACHVMEVGCGALGGNLTGSCSYNPYLPTYQQCYLPGCWCGHLSLDGNCGIIPVFIGSW